MGRKHDKPVGLDGSLRHEVGPAIDERTFQRHVEPKPKDAIEADIAAAFRHAAQDGLGYGGITIRQLPENDLDFEWTQGDRVAKLEFTELVLENPPYRETGQSATIPYKPWAEKFCGLVQKKNAKSYAHAHAIDLLVYTTHFAYHGNKFCAAWAAERLRHLDGAAGFDRVFYLEFRGEASRVYQLKPYPARLAPRLRREYEAMRYSTVNFAEGTPVPGGTRFDLRLPPRAA